MPTRILITGGAGFVGSHLALGLKKAFDGEVVALDNLRRRGSELNLPRLAQRGVKFVHGDIRNPDDVAGAGGFDLLVECSAEPSVLAGYSDSRYVVDTNLVGTINCLEAARGNKADVLFLSTSRVYPLKALNSLRYSEGATRLTLQDDQELPGASAKGISEHFPLTGTRSLYGATKLASELLIQEYLEMYGLRGLINRCGILTGPWQMGKVDQGIVVLWAARHIYGGPLAYIGYGGKGKQVRDMLHVDDLLGLVQHQVQHLERLNGEVFNVGGGLANSASLLELTALCRQRTGQALDVTSNPETRPADIPIYITDNAKITAATGWQPRMDAQTIVSDICDWIEAHKEALRPILS